MKKKKKITRSWYRFKNSVKFRIERKSSKSLLSQDLIDIRSIVRILGCTQMERVNDSSDTYASITRIARIEFICV